VYWQASFETGQTADRRRPAWLLRYRTWPAYLIWHRPFRRPGCGVPCFMEAKWLADHKQ